MWNGTKNQRAPFPQRGSTTESGADHVRRERQRRFDTIVDQLSGTSHDRVSVRYHSQRQPESDANQWNRTRSFSNSEQSEGPIQRQRTGTPGHSLADVTLANPHRDSLPSVSAHGPTAGQPTFSDSASKEEGATTGRWNPDNVVVDKFEQDLALPTKLKGEILHSLANKTSVEFGHSTDPTRSMERLSSNAGSKNGTRAGKRPDQLIVPGLSQGGLERPNDDNLRRFGSRLSASLPFRRFRFRREEGRLQLEGKINPWVRVAADGKTERSNNPQANPPAGTGWRWVHSTRTIRRRDERITYRGIR